MKRLLLVVLASIVAVGLLWFVGKAPTRYVLERECERFQQKRREGHVRLTARIAKLEQERVQTGRRDHQLDLLKQLLEGVVRTPHRTTMRGWSVIFIPTGAERPEPGDFLVYGRHDPSAPTDPHPLRGEMEIWIQATGGLARVVFWLGLSP